MPEPHEVYEALKGIRSRSDVADVRVEVAMFDGPEWPFAETVWVITSAGPEKVKSWLTPELTPDDVWAGWANDRSFEPVSVPPGMRPVACWYD